MKFRYSWRKMAEAFANSEDPDQTPRSAVSDLGLQCLPITRLEVSGLQWVNEYPQHMFMLRNKENIRTFDWKKNIYLKL